MSHSSPATSRTLGTRRTRRIRRIAVPIAAALLLAGCASGSTDSGTSGATGDSAPLPILTQEVLDAEAEAGSGTDNAAADTSLAETALDVLDTIPVAERTEWDGYFQRDEYFGEGWADLDGDDCNTRQEVLADQLEEVELNRDGCRVDFGVLDDPYTGETVEFMRGQGTSDKVQIDHVVALYNAWRTGAQDLTQQERLELANDPMNLQPTVDWANDEKESSDASQWLPPDETYHCTYVARQIVIKATYDLWVTPDEDAAMRDVLAGCV
ncbi:HNH endonuclease family protein [Gulosibacter molinativorax]|uniref:HNH endonuclease n=1 Tax=Gulosibacter molinativorax TaxID=256821 RepID=A0ABT7C694_9MICO|nr:HNH endonuclease family protein [Gulosibacter molinativorax]MDJ1370731.1 HNH endonuclease [Gulosibacter molinativorax]QUY63243.1 Calcium-binding protein [Gulosibacter molinativorax]